MKLLKNGYFLSFMLSFLLGCLILVPSIIVGDGILTLIADFNLQQIPFNEYLNEAVKNGDIFWTWINDLGSNFIGTFSFYNIASPFVLLGFLFPANCFPYLIGIIFIFKYAVAGLTSYIYIKQYVKNEKWALIGSLLYSFSGFQISNTLFYSFHDIVAFFPLLLYSLDKLVLENKKLLFCIMVALSIFINYYFFIGEVVFLVIYYLTRVFTKTYPFSLKSFGKVLFNGCLGVGISMVIFLPSILFVLDNPRIDNAWTLHTMLLHSKETYLEIIRALILPSDVMSGPLHSIIADHNFLSVELFLPFTGAVLAFAYTFKKRNSWPSILFIVCLIFMFIPILNSSFFAFTNAYYARWFYMPTLIMALLSAKCLDEKIPIKSGVIITIILFILLALGLSYIYFLKHTQVVYNKNALIIYLTAFGICLVSLCLIMKYSKNKFLWILIGIFIYVTLRGNYFFYQNKGNFSKDDDYINNYLTAGETLNFKTKDIRYDYASTCNYNIGFLTNSPSLKNFNTNISGGAFEFWQATGIPEYQKRSVMTRLDDSETELRNFLSVKYIVSCGTKNETLNNNFKLKDKKKSYYIYENKNYKKMGISYNYYISEKDYELNDYPERRKLLNEAVILNNNQIKKYKNILQKYNSQSKNFTNKLETNKFEFGKGKFTSKIKTNKQSFIVYTVPYDKGWTATINNKKVKFEKVDNGLIGLTVNKGMNNIEFKYSPPGFKLGLIISIISVIILIIQTIYEKTQKNTF